MRRLVLVLAALAILCAGAFAARRASWLLGREPEPAPAPEPTTGSTSEAAARTPAATIDATGLEPAEATALYRVWLAHGNAEERARAAEALAALGAAAPSPASQPVLASLAPAAAWEAHAARRRGVEETLDPSVPAHESAIERLRERWAAQIRAALPGWLPASSEDRLALARLADEAGEHGTLVRQLESLRDTGEEGRVAATWLVTLRLDDGDVEGASAALARVRDDFAGEGLDARGRRIPQSLLAESLVERSTRIARESAEGPSPDIARAKRALSVSREFATRDDEPALDAADRYVALADAPLDLAAVVPALPRTDGPSAVVFTDDFQLGEAVLPSVLRRWSKGLRVVLIGRLTGKTRSGIRRVPAASEADERALLSEHARAAHLPIVGFIARGGPEESRLGLAADAGAAVFVLDAGSRIVARASGNALDPRSLDPVVARLVPDPTVVAPPSDGPPR